MRSGCGGRGRGTWTGGCWANDLHQNKRGAHYCSPSACAHAVDVEETDLVLEAGREPLAEGWRGQCGGSFLRSHRWQKRMLIRKTGFFFLSGQPSNRIRVR